MPNWTGVSIKRNDGSDLFDEKHKQEFIDKYCRIYSPEYDKDTTYTGVDFRKFMPQPALMINRSIGSETVKAISYYFEKHRNELTKEELDKLLNGEKNEDPTKDNFIDKVTKEYEEAGKPVVENLLPDWYDWNNDNWGTKWNSCYGVVFEDEVFFNTAWDKPTDELMNMILKVIRDYSIASFPEEPPEEHWLSIQVEYEGEDFIEEYSFGEDETMDFEQKIWTEDDEAQDDDWFDDNDDDGEDD